MATSDSRYESFLENFDKGNTFLQSAAQSFIDQVNIDKHPILASDDLQLSQSFQSIENVLSNNDINSYEKMNQTGTLLTSLTPQIINSKDAIAKQSGKNILNSFFNVAKKTEDQQMLSTASQIASHF